MKFKDKQQSDDMNSVLNYMLETEIEDFDLNCMEDGIVPLKGKEVEYALAKSNLELALELDNGCEDELNAFALICDGHVYCCALRLLDSIKQFKL